MGIHGPMRIPWAHMGPWDSMGILGAYGNPMGSWEFHGATRFSCHGTRCPNGNPMGIHGPMRIPWAHMGPCDFNGPTWAHGNPWALALPRLRQVKKTRKSKGDAVAVVEGEGSTELEGEAPTEVEVEAA